MRIICLGDSITYGFGLETLSQRWSDLVAARTGHTMINRGVSGDTTGGMLARLQTEVFPENPDLLVFLGGVNDIAYTLEHRSACANIVSITRQAVARKLPVIVGLPLPIVPQQMRKPWDPFRDHIRHAEELEKYVNFIVGDAKVKNFPVADFRTPFFHPDGSIRGELIPDGVHPNAEGHRLMADVLCRVLEERFSGC